MKRAKIGVNLPGSIHLEELHDTLLAFQQDGFDAVEIYMPTFPLVLGGKICSAAVKYMGDVLREFPFTYTAHIDAGLDLRKIEERTLQENVLFRSIDICGELGLSPLTLHFDAASPFTEREHAFFDSSRRAADYAAKQNVLLCVENIEVENYRRVVEMVQRMNHPNFKMTLDTGHLYLASCCFGYPYLEAVNECAPYVRHVHLNDNTGNYEPTRFQDPAQYRTIPLDHPFTFGRGDIHLPPLWGEIPMDQVIQILTGHGYNGIYLCEYEGSHFKPFHRSIQENIRKFISQIQEKSRSGNEDQV